MRGAISHAVHGQCPADRHDPRGGQSLARSSHETDWEDVAQAAPVLAATCRRYLQQLGVSLRPKSVAAIDITLRQFAGFLVAADPRSPGSPTLVAPTSRPSKPTSAFAENTTNATSKTTIGMRLGHLHAFFHRINTWGYDDAPSRIPIMLGDKPIRDKPLPRFLDDPSAAKLLQAARNLPEQFDRLAVELLARTGMQR